MNRPGADQGQQIPLPFTRYEPLDFDLYLTGDNAEVQSILEQSAIGQRKGSIYLWGDHGSGKSHLLQATCQRAADAGRSVAYVPLKLFADKPVAVVEGLDRQQLVCIDDLDVIAGRGDWEESLFHLYNELNDQGSVLLMTSLAGPQWIDIQLPDLKSRLTWGLVYQLQGLNDDDKLMLLKRKAHARGFDLSNEVAEYLLARAPRDLHSLLSLLDKIDQASLSEQRKITIPFVKTLL